MQGRLSAADLGRISVDEEHARRQRHSRRRRDLVAGALEGGSEAAHSHVDAGAWVPVHRGRGVRCLPLIIISAPNLVITLLITLASHFLLVSPIMFLRKTQIVQDVPSTRRWRLGEGGGGRFSPGMLNAGTVHDPSPCVFHVPCACQVDLRAVPPASLPTSSSAGPQRTLWDGYSSVEVHKYACCGDVV
jgi:hypothetical protein